MKLIKMFGLAAVAAVVAMAFVGATSASATLNTLLCKVHIEPCPAGSIPAEAHFVAGTTVLKTNLATVLCLVSLAIATALGLGTAPNPQVLHNTTITLSNCGTNVAHNNCTVTTVALGLIDLLRTVLNLGTIKFLNIRIHVACSGIIDCEYGGPEVPGFTVEGALHTASAGHGLIIANELSIPKFAGGILCPTTSKWTAKYESLEHLFLVG